MWFWAWGSAWLSGVTFLIQINDSGKSHPRSDKLGPLADHQGPRFPLPCCNVLEKPTDQASL